MPEIADVVVVGGGVEGASIAFQLAKRRVGRVVLVERDGIATGATGRSSAIVRMHYTHEALARMALHALGVFQRFRELVGGESGFRNTGALILASERDAEALRANVAMHQRVGIESRVLEPAEIAEVEPRLDAMGVGAAAWEPRSGYAEPVGTASGFAAAAREHGAELRLGTTVGAVLADGGRVSRVETSRGPIETRAVVVAAGFRSRDLLAPLGWELPLEPVRHSIAILERSADFGQPHPVILDYANGGYYRPEGETLSLVGSSASNEGRVDNKVEHDATADLGELELHVGRFYQRFPTQSAATLRRSYTGVYDCTPDLQPMLGPVPGVEGLHLACGFSGHGFKLSPAIGELLADSVLGQRSEMVDLELFSPGRFAAGRPITVAHPYSRQTLG